MIDKEIIVAEWICPGRTLSRFLKINNKYFLEGLYNEELWRCEIFKKDSKWFMRDNDDFEEITDKKQIELLNRFIRKEKLEKLLK